MQTGCIDCAGTQRYPNKQPDCHVKAMGNGLAPFACEGLQHGGLFIAITLAYCKPIIPNWA